MDSVGIWMDKPEGWYILPIMVFCSFFIGLAFMLLYYRYFHVRRLRYEAGGRFQGDSLEKSRDCNEYGNTILNLDSQCINDCSKYSTHAIPGVFNCRFSNPVVNAATKRKKKKPTIFVPPPTLALPSQHDPDQDSSTTGLCQYHFGDVLYRDHIPADQVKMKEPGDDMRGSLPRQAIPRVKKHINVNTIEWRPGSPDSRLDLKIFNDLNILSSPNIEQANNLNKYSTNYDPLYNSFGMSGTNIPAVSKDIYNDTGQHSTQVPSNDSNTLKMQIMSRSKLPFMMMRNPFTEQYGGNYSNIYPEATNVWPPSISPRNTTNSPSRTAQFNHHSGLYIEVNHPRQISGTYSTIYVVAGLTSLRAENIIKYCIENGPFKSRDTLKKVKQIGEKTFIQCAGFIRIEPKTAGVTEYSYNVLDSMWVHPESYELAGKILKKCNLNQMQIISDYAIKQIKLFASKNSIDDIAKDFGVPNERITCLLDALQRELFRDYRCDFDKKPLFKQGLTKMSDGTCVTGAVTNITHFGCFVDIGVETNGLFHSSQLYGMKPNIGDRVAAEVVDLNRRRIQLKLQSIL